MSLQDALTVVVTGITSIGSAAAIIFGLSSWLGKVWANRLMESEKAAHARDLEKLRSELQHTNEVKLSQLKEELDTYKQKHLRGHGDKVRIYRLVVDVVINLLGDLDMAQQLAPIEAVERWDKFNRGRMQAYGYLAMLAPQSVMDTYDALFDHLILVTKGCLPYAWPKVRELVLRLLNEVRKDIGFDPSPIEYRGKL